MNKYHKPAILLTMTNTKIVLAFIGIMTVAILFRFAAITTTPPGLYPDEAVNGNNGLSAFRTGEFSWFYPENNGREGLFINIQALAIHAIGIREPWVLRSVSAVFGVLTVLGIFFLGKELYGTNIGLLAALFLAVNFWHVNFSRIGFRAIMAPFFATWGLYCLIKTFHKNSSQWVWWAISAGLLLGGGFHSYIAYRILPAIALIVVGYAFIINQDKKIILKKTAVVISVGIIAITPLILYFIENQGSFLGRTSQVSIFSAANPLTDLTINIAKTIGMLFVWGDQNWRHNISGAPALVLPVALAFIVGILQACKHTGTLARKLISRKIASIIDRKEFASVLLIGWIGCAALPVVISNEGIPHALRSILMIPPIILLAAQGSIVIYQKAKQYVPKKLTVIATIILLSGIVIHGYWSYFRVWSENKNVRDAFTAQYVELGRYINSLPKETPKYIIVKGQGTLVRGIPMPAQTVMFITDTYDAEEQKKKNIFYVTAEQEQETSIPSNAIKIILE
ncbi:MAG: hypothetical protein RIQ54_478 [Candidatus Parcubacteria bacterium]|jgi:4-amino-4-deoxy-L-arabinose transferase-like glycosyltransferase